MNDYGAQNQTITAAVDALRSRIRVSMATTDSEFEAVFRLRHRCYLDEGAISSSVDGRLTDIYDDPGRSKTFGLHDDGGLIASIRLQILSSDNPNSPSAAAFPDIIEPLVRNGHSLLDPTRFVIASEASRRYPALAYFALRIPFIAAQHFRVNVALAAVRSEHMPFYRRFLRYETQASPRPYLQLIKPLGLMVADYWRERPGVLARYPFLEAKPGEVSRLLAQEIF
jgi:hypothetical protein